MTMNMKLWCSKVRFVRMFYKVWTWLLPSLGFEGAKINFYCRTQWKVARPRLRSERRATHHLAWSSSASMKMESAAPQIPPANIRNEEILRTVVTNWYWGRSRLPIATRCWWCWDIKKKTCSSRPEKKHLATSNLSECAVTVWQIDIWPLDIWWRWNDK